MGGRAVKGYSRREFVKSSAVGLAGLSAGFPRVRRASAAGKGEVEQVTVGLVQEAFTVDPHMNFSRYNLDTVNQIFEQLVHRDAKAEDGAGARDGMAADRRAHLAVRAPQGRQVPRGRAVRCRVGQVLI